MSAGLRATVGLDVLRFDIAGDAAAVWNGDAVLRCPSPDRLWVRAVFRARDDDDLRFFVWLRPLDRPFDETGRATFQYLSSVLESDARFFVDRSTSRQSPFHPSRTVSAPSDPSRSSINTSTVVLAISCPSVEYRSGRYR